MKQDIQEYHRDKVEAYASDGVRGVWYWGPPGSGKSHKAREICEQVYQCKPYDKHQNKWWDSYDNQHAVLIEDLDTNTLGHHLKIWADKYPCTGETKGGHVNLNHRVLIVTSNYSIETLFKEDRAMCEAIKTRF